MNLLIFEAGELDNSGQLRLCGRRLRHLNNVLGVKPGDCVRVGQLGGKIGTGAVLSIAADAALIAPTLDRRPPPAMPLTVVLALPRPKMLRRILRGLAETGVKDIHLINSYRVEKSYWQSPLLREAALKEALLSGLEQAVDTILPEVTLHKRFRPFVEDLLPSLCAGRDALLADINSTETYPATPGDPGLLLIGPEGGFIPFERDFILRIGARGVTLGPRTLRVETALHCALGRHLPSNVR